MREEEIKQQRLLHMVESAQRAGYSEVEIREIVDEAVEADAEVVDVGRAA